MAKKKSGKKSHQVDDDEYADQPIPTEDPGDTAQPGYNKDEDGNDLGGLMSHINKPTAKPKKSKKTSNKNKYDDDEEDAVAMLEKMDLAESADSPVAETKKGSKKAPSVQSTQQGSDREGEGGETRIKSKKEKEKERKERAKLAKKQQEKKSAAASKPIQEEEDGAGTPEEEESTDKKKKKKKGAKKEEEAPKKRKGGPPSAAVAALKAAMEKQAAEEQRQKELLEEQQRLQEEEEARILAEEARIEQKKREKKEKERLKKEELKRSGKYQTAAQKQAAAIAQERLAATLASGAIKIAALENEDGTSTTKPKKVVYGKKKKNNQKSSGASTPTSTTSATPVKVEVSKKLEPVKEKEVVKESWDADSEDELKKKNDNVKESWDMDSEDELKKKDEVKESWDMESEDEVKKDTTAAKPVDKRPASPSKAPTKGAPSPSKAPVKRATSPARSVSPTKTKKVEESEDESDEDSEEDTDDESSEEEDSEDEEASFAEKERIRRKEEAAIRKEARHQEALAARSADNLRSPICVILGHVDTGKTKLLDKIRQTNVQEGEAGGITQQIGATYFPMDAVKTKTARLRSALVGDANIEYKIPGLLIIDTPGHESFTNLRSRGSSLCNIAVLVVDIMHGLEPQTIESIGLLKQRKTPFVVALNKIDRLFDWKAYPDYPFQETLSLQAKHVQAEFKERVEKTKLAFAEQGLNSTLYYDNKNFAKFVSLIPTSAITGEGIPDLLHLLVNLTQSRMTESLMYLSELECTVLEVKVIEGLGTTIDVILSNGVLHEGDRIVVCGLNGPIVTNIRALLTPQLMRELRIKSAYVKNKQVKAALGIKISAPDLEKAIAGSRLLVVGPDDDEEDLKEEVMSDLKDLMHSIDKSGKGVCVQASTLGSLEALLSFLKDSKIPVSGINIGPVHKKDIIRASVMLERAPQFAQMLAFDVPVDKDASDLAEEVGVKIFKADIIYHLFDKFKAYMAEIAEQQRKDQAPSAVFPCLLKIIPGMIFNKRSPIILGCDVIEGQLRIGTPICVLDENKKIVDIGKVTGLEINKKAKELVKKGDPSVAVKLEAPGYATPKAFGRHFDEKNELYSHVTRSSIDILKTTFRNDLSKEDWALVVKLKNLFKIA